MHALIPGPKAVGETAIDKRPVPGPVAIGWLGPTGDQVCDLENHGGEEQAVYAYADEDADWWAEHLHREIPPGLFGENLRTAGVDVTNAVIGERWRAGSVLFEVTSPRIPCGTFAADLFLRPRRDVLVRLLDADGHDGFILPPRTRAYVRRQAGLSALDVPDRILADGSVGPTLQQSSSTDGDGTRVNGRSIPPTPPGTWC